MEIKMAWRAKPEMTTAHTLHTRTISQSSQCSATTAAQSPLDESSHAGPRISLVRPFSPLPQTTTGYDHLKHASARPFAETREVHPQSDSVASVSRPTGVSPPHISTLGHARTASSSTLPLNIPAKSGHSRVPSSISLHAIPEPTTILENDDVPFPTLADTSDSGVSVDSKAEKRKSKSERLMSFFAGFLAGGGLPPEQGEVDAPLLQRDEDVLNRISPIPMGDKLLPANVFAMGNRSPDARQLSVTSTAEPIRDIPKRILPVSHSTADHRPYEAG